MIKALYPVAGNPFPFKAVICPLISTVVTVGEEPIS
jgi:hypothetical protein